MEGTDDFFPILLTSYGLHIVIISRFKSVPVGHAYFHAFPSHFYCAIQGGIKVKYIRLKSKVIVTRQMVRIAFKGHETSEIS